jgi:hypothetical protein
MPVKQNCESIEGRLDEFQSGSGANPTRFVGCAPRMAGAEERLPEAIGRCRKMSEFDRREPGGK